MPADTVSNRSRRWRLATAAAATVVGGVIVGKLLTGNRKATIGQEYLTGKQVLVPAVDFQHATAADVIFALRRSTPLKLRGNDGGNGDSERYVEWLRSRQLTH